jgi:hypothetical protein
MDRGTAFRLLKEGRPVSLIIDGRRVDGAMVIGNPVSSGGPGYIDLLLATPIGEPDKRVRVRVDQVELAT